MLLTATYFLAGKFGLLLAFANPSASPVWPLTGIALAVGILTGTRYWPTIFAGAFLVNMTTAGTVATSLAIATGNTLEALIGAYLIRHYAGGTAAFQRVDRMLAFIAAAGVACAVSATIGVGSLLLAGFAPLSAAGATWFTWWLGDLGGALIVAPFILLWHERRSVSRQVSRVGEATGLLLFLGAISVAFFTTAVVPGSAHHPLVYLCVLPILWAAVRFQPRETITAVALLSCLAVIGTLYHFGPFAVSDLNTSLTLLQAFMVIASIIGLTLAAAMMERRAAEALLEKSVGDRTRELEGVREQDRANTERLRATIANLPMAALLMDENSHIIELNDAYCKIFGMPITAEEAMKISPDELLQHFLAQLQDPEGHMQKVREALERKEPIFNLDIHLKDGRIIARDFFPIREQGTHRGLLFLYRDVTKERKADRAKSEFMSLASHQLRTPLTGIRWGLSHLQRHLAGMLGEPHDKILAESAHAAARMAETIEIMLNISRMEADKVRLDTAECDLCDVLHQKEEFFRNQYQAKHQSFMIECPDRLPLHTDVALIREILRNLLQNAIKYTPNGGKMFLRAYTEQDVVVIEVEDTGYGIPARQQHLVFQKFFRGENIVGKDTSGNGLGLYLVALLTKTLGGTISMQSREGVGTVFTLRLPIGSSEELKMSVGTVAGTVPKPTIVQA